MRGEEGEGEEGKEGDLSIDSPRAVGSNDPIKRRNSIFIFFLLQSPHCAANCLQHIRSSGHGAIACKSRATHRALITCNMLCGHVVRRDSSAVKSDRIELAFILALFYWLKRLTDEGGEETGVPGENP